MRKRLSTNLTMFSQFSEEAFDWSRDEGEILMHPQFFQPEEIFHQLEEHIQEISEIFQLEFDSALLVYQHYRFNMSQLQNSFLIEKDLVFEKFMIMEISAIPQRRQTRRTKKKIYCRSCYDETEEISALSCGHEFCFQCWRGFLSQKIKEQFIFIVCMESGCKQPVTHSFIKHVFQDDPQETQNYLICLGKRYIDENQSQNLLHIKWCPGVDCIYSVSSIIVKENEVLCPNGHHWCYICRQEAHSPVPCNIVSAWNKIVSSQSENVKWIQENAKLCPFCHRPVEKNQGCNFINCRPPGGCGKNFCYVCNKPWEPTHSDHFKCPFENDIQQMNEEDMQRAILAIYNEHYSNFKKCFEQDINIFISIMRYQKDVEINFGKKLPQIKDFLHIEMDISTNEVLFISEEIEKLLETWKKLKWTYALSHSVQQSKHSLKNLTVLQHLQTETMKEGEELMKEMKKLFSCLDLKDKQQFNKQQVLQIQQNTKGGLVKLCHYLKIFQDEIQSGDFFSNEQKVKI